MHADYSSQGFDQLLCLIDKIKNNPDDCRIILSAWNPSDLKQMTFPPCHMFAQFYVNQGELSCQMYQLSADIGLGVPFNIICYRHAWSLMFVILFPVILSMFLVMLMSIAVMLGLYIPASEDTKPFPISLKFSFTSKIIRGGNFELFTSKCVDLGCVLSQMVHSETLG